MTSRISLIERKINLLSIEVRIYCTFIVIINLAILALATPL